MALAWLVLHASAVVGTAAVLLPFNAPVEGSVVCRCDHGAEHGSCPMHRTPAGAARCLWEGSATDLGTALTAMFGPLTFGAPQVSLMAPVPVPTAATWTTDAILDGTTPPDAPPPRR